MGAPTGLFLRVFVEAGDIKTAIASAAEIIDCLGSESSPRDMRIQPYWKIEGWQEITFDIQVDDCASAFRPIANRLSDQWLFGGAEDDPFALWDRRDHGNSLMGASTRWAHLQYSFPPAD